MSRTGANPASWSFLPLQIKDRRVNPFVRLHHGFDGKTLLNPQAAGAAIDFGKPLEGSYRLVDVINQKTRLPVFDHLTARAKVHGDSGHTSGIGFCQDKSESLRDSVQVQQSSGTREQLILARYVHRPDVADRPIKVGLTCSRKCV